MGVGLRGVGAADWLNAGVRPRGNEESKGERALREQARRLGQRHGRKAGLLRQNECLHAPGNGEWCVAGRPSRGLTVTPSAVTS